MKPIRDAWGFWQPEKRRRKITMLVTVSVPANMPAAMARREVRTLITHQANYQGDPGDVKCVGIKPPPIY